MTPDNTNPPPAPPASRPARGGSRLWLLVALAALALAGWQWLETRGELAGIRQEVADRLAAAESAAGQNRDALKRMAEQSDGLQGRLATTEGRLAEYQEQADALQGLSRNLVRSNEEAALLEVEQAVTLAAQQLQLAANVPLALVALQAADSRLARLDRPQWLPLRKALASDIDRLRALPLVDTVGVSLRLEQVAASVDRLLLAMDARPRAVRESGGEAAPLPWWQRAGAEAWQVLRGLVRIERFDAVAPELLAPSQVYFLRENLRLRLLNARLALLSRDQAAFRNDLKLAADWLERYFDGRDKAVQNALATLRQLQGGEINVALPNLGETQAALRALRNGKDRR